MEDAMSNTLEPTKRDVFAIAEYLGCNEKELWSEVSKLLQRQDNCARIDELGKIDSRSFMSLGSDFVYTVYQSDLDKRIAQLKKNK